MATSFTITLTELFKAHILDVHLPNILVGMTASIEVPLVTTVGRAINADHSQIANFVLLSAVCRTALDIPFGIVVEFVGVRNVMLACLLINIAAAVLGTQIAGFAAMNLYCALSGISLGGFFLSRHIFVAGISSKKYRGLLMSFLSGLLRWSHVLGPLITGLIASRTGDTRNAFYVAALTSSMAFVSLIAALYSPIAKKQCDHSCATSTHPSVAATPTHTDADEAEGMATAGSGAGSSSSAAVPVSAPHAAHPHVPAIPPVPGRAAANLNPFLLPPSSAPHGSGDVSASCVKVHPSMGAHEEHHFHISAIWYTVVDYWSVIWRLGIYVVFFGALRSNRKLLIMFAGMRENMSDAQVSYLLSFSFIFDAMLFPLGGIIMDFMGRQFAMVPVALGLGLCFLVLPLCHTPTQLYMASSAFGIADAMGCGVVMTLTADRAPKLYGAPFFGIMRTLADLGHVVGAGGVSFLVRTVGHDATCLVLAALGVFIALWGVLGVPRDTEPLETPRLAAAAARHDRRRNYPEHGAETEGAMYPPHTPFVSPAHGVEFRPDMEERPLLSSDAHHSQQHQQGRHNNAAQGYGAAL